MAVLQAASIVRTSLESITGEEAGRWTLMMKNMGNWSRLEKGNGMGGLASRLQQTSQRMRTKGTRNRIPVTGFRTQDTKQRTQDKKMGWGLTFLLQQTVDEDTRQKKQDSGFRI